MGSLANLNENKQNLTASEEKSEERKKMEKLLSLAVEQSTEGIAISDIDGNLLFVNPAFANMHGYKPEELIGKHLLIFHTPDQTPLVKVVNQQVRETGVFHGEIWHKHRNGTVFPAIMHNSLVRDEHSNPIGLIGTLLDITERKKTEQELKKSEEMYRSLMEGFSHVKIGIDIVSIDYTVLFQNQILKERFGDISGKLCYEKYMGLKDPCDFCPMIKAIKKNKIETVELTAADGRNYELISAPFPNPDGIIDKAAEVIIDITERRKAEQKLKESEEQYREAYNRSDLYKDLFTHDINNILQNILSSVELSKLYSKDPTKKEKFEEVSNLVSEQIVRGKRLVSNVQKLSEVEEIKTPITSLEASKILNNAIEFVKGSFPHKTLNFEFKSFQNQYFVIANDLLINIFENVLFNAVKHNTHDNIEVLIRISRDKKNGANFIKFEFIDNGVGISDSMKQEIFSRDYKEYKKDKVPSGIGLGLLLVKRVLDSYSGEIKVEDKVEGDFSKGSNFIILIPEDVQNS